MNEYKNMIVPEKLRNESEIAIISPAGIVKPDYVYAAKKQLEKFNFKAHIFPSCLNEFYRYAGTDTQRLNDLQNAVDNENIGAILCARGGYGTLRIINNLNLDKFTENPKWLIGFSDITILHSVINKSGVASIHGPMGKSFYSEKGKTPVKKLVEILTGNFPEYNFEKHSLNKNKTVTGELTGGNLSTMYSMQGTQYEIDTNGKILFIEDLNEYLYHLDRMMLNLKLSGKLTNLKALVVGAFTDMNDGENSFGKNAYEIIKEHVENYDYPVFFGFPAGHIDINLPLIFGMNYKISVNDKNILLQCCSTR